MPVTEIDIIGELTQKYLAEFRENEALRKKIEELEKMLIESNSEIAHLRAIED